MTPDDIAADPSRQSDQTADVLAALDGLGVALRVVRIMRGVSLRQVARDTGLSASTVMRIEQGDDCTVSNARAVLAWIKETT